MQNYLELIFEAYRKNGKRLTKQRRTIITALLENKDKSCKELYYIAHEKDKTINPATIYRTLKSLEELGFIQRKNGISMTDSL